MSKCVRPAMLCQNVSESKSGRNLCQSVSGWIRGRGGVLATVADKIYRRIDGRKNFAMWRPRLHHNTGANAATAEMLDVTARGSSKFRFRDGRSNSVVSWLVLVSRLNTNCVIAKLRHLQWTILVRTLLI